MAYTHTHTVLETAHSIQSPVAPLTARHRMCSSLRLMAHAEHRKAQLASLSPDDAIARVIESFPRGRKFGGRMRELEGARSQLLKRLRQKEARHLQRQDPLPRYSVPQKKPGHSQLRADPHPSSASCPGLVHPRTRRMAASARRTTHQGSSRTPRIPRNIAVPVECESSPVARASRRETHRDQTCPVPGLPTLTARDASVSKRRASLGNV